MKQIKWFAVFALALGVFLTACNKEDLTLGFEDSEQMVASTDQTTSEDLYADVEDQVDLAIETRGAGQDCPEVTVEPADGSYPRTITIDFGDGCEGPNGRIRKGQIVVTVSDTMSNEGATRTTTFVDFFIDDAQIEGTKTLTNLGPDADGNVTFQRTVDGQITFPNGDVATWQADHFITQIEGADTPTCFDNVFAITGGSSGVNRHGKAYSTEILEPVIRKKTCPWRVAGVLSLTVEDKTVTIDYGDGSCDRKAILTAPDGTQHVILIKKWWK
ncbi:MAG: hypothetical protein CMN32_02600 [Saprospirales bacterium]|nr:hypothetical protein [Saprospirales bacterium]